MNLPSYTCGPQEKPLLAMTIGAAFDQTVSRFPEREALVVRDQGLRYSWAQLGEAVDRWFRPSGRAGHALFDLPAYIVARLGAFGVGSVRDIGLCTYGDETRFFSYRRMTHRGEPDYGRHLSAIALAA